MFVIRKATVDDIPLIHDLAEKVFPATYRGIITDEQISYMMEWMYSFASLQMQMTQDGHQYFIAFANDIPVGYVSIQPQGDDVFHLQKIYVLPTMQGHGYGKKLFLNAIDAVRALHPDGSCRMELNVNRNNPALYFYQKMGMYQLSQGDFDIGNGYYMNDYIMALDIHP